MKARMRISVGEHEFFGAVPVKREPAVFPSLRMRALKVRFSGVSVKHIPFMQNLRFSVNQKFPLAGDSPEKLDKRLAAGGNPFIVFLQADVMADGTQKKRQGKIGPHIRLRPVDAAWTVRFRRPHQILTVLPD